MIYDLLAPAYSTTVESNINVNKIQEPTLIALVPTMTPEERKKFFEDRDQTATATASPAPNATPDADTGPFKAPNDFFEYLKNSLTIVYNNKFFFTFSILVFLYISFFL